MKWGSWSLVLAACTLAACTPKSTLPEGHVLLDEQVTLVRETRGDSARRTLRIEGPSLIVARADEQLQDLRLTLSFPRGGVTRRHTVENNLAGASIEIAALEVPAGPVEITLEAPPDVAVPAKVRLRVQRFDPERRNGYRAWSEATTASHRVDAMRRQGIAALDEAIALFAASDAALSAEARLLKANALHFFHLDSRESRAEARRAARAFEALGAAGASGRARSQYLEALALIAMSGDGAAVEPTSAEATRLARELLLGLTGPDSVLSAVERARALGARGHLEAEAGNTDDANRLYLEALALFEQAGDAAGVRDMRFSQAVALMTRGQFRDAASAFDQLRPELDKVTNPDRRAFLLICAARALGFSGRADEAPDLLHQALTLAREYNLRSQQAGALQGLGNLLVNRGDPLQAREYYDEVIRISREDNDVVQLNAGLQVAGFVARADGDFERAIRLHQEGVRIASTPVATMRTLRELGMDYYAQGDYAAALAELRRALDVKMQDATHHAYSDIKRNYVEAMIAAGQATARNLPEARRLLAESLASSIRVGDKLGEIGAYRVRASLFATLHQPAAARADFERALALAHEYRARSASSESRKAMLTHEQLAIRDYLDMEMQDVVARGRAMLRAASPREQRMLRLIEFARDANYRAARTGELDAATTGQVDGLLGSMADRSLKIATLLGQELSPAQRTELDRLQLEMLDLYSNLDRVRTAASSRRAVMQNFKPDLARPWRPVPAQGVQLSYALGTQHVYLWVRDGKGVRVAALSLPPRDLESELIALSALDPQAEPEKIDASLSRVSRLLLLPGALPEGTSSVEVVAEGRIAGVPFGGLRPPGAGSKTLLETHAITMITSLYEAESAPQARQARPLRLVALASGSGTLRSAPVKNPAPRLQAATAEIRAVAELFTSHDPAAKIRLLTGPEGNAAALRSMWSSGADVVHFATHSLADLRQPLASLLVLPALDAAGKPTYLTAGQIQGWRGDAGLVFLSACESAIGPPRYAGGMPGLQNAFLRAGARGVVATLWPIEDVLARDFSAAFYGRFTAGQPAVQALIETQREWLRPAPGSDEGERARRRITALAHSYYTQ